MITNKYKINLESMPVVPLRGLSIFPYMMIHFDVGRPKSMKAIEVASMKEEPILLVTQKDAKTEDPKADDFYHWGTVANIKQIMKLPTGGIRVMIEAKMRGHIENFTDEGEYFEANVATYEPDFEENDFDDEVTALVRLIKKDLEEYVSLHPKIPENVFMNVYDEDDPERFTDIAAAITLLKEDEYQNLIKELDIKKRLTYYYEVLQKELELLELEEKINVRVRNQMSKMQKDYYLREQIKAIRKELGEEEEIHAEIEELKKAINDKPMPIEVKEKALKEVKRLSQNAFNTAETGVIRNYLDLILDLPWEEASESEIDLDRTMEILNRDHYGLVDIKDRIVEYLAVKKLNPDSKGNILLFVGPPGVGKTSIARSIAEALDREFVRVSLGGVRDEAEIRGHRRTYVGAMPGRIISGIKKAGTKNPVFLLDEIDKINSDFRGDPASALLEVLDPEQNKDFVDNYLDLEFDLSQVLFITTANSLDIPPALLDRMEVIRISGYTDDEKLNIASKYLLRKQRENAGLNTNNFNITKPAIREIIEAYTREAGVRNLERELAKVIRKAAVKIAKGEVDKVSVGIKEVHEFLGPEIFTADVLGKRDKVGVANGLAWTSVGGVNLQVEAIATPGSGKIQLTGKLGDVMKESAFGAVTYIRKNAEKLGVEDDFYKKTDIHIHVPEGAVPKDGPSAGITIATAILSALSNKPVDRTVAMTGELTITGRVLAIGGLKEKVLAANRMGIKEVIIPEDNAKDLSEIPDNVKENIEFHFVKNVGEVFKIALR
ncbi:endopeptidase La [Ezakiella peruensis]|uniref:endopeptidase La n=1 Tax=Ezakiella peruensis TaxID=1464038 RepID=UPI000C1B5CC4|nr:endopeptidase La [Ezakiella peruensis]